MPSYLDYHGLETLKSDLELLYIKNARKGVSGGVATLNNEGKVPASQLPDIGGANNPVFTGSISLGRKEGTTVGTGSVALGNDVTATGNYSQAEGDNSVASGRGAHAEGASLTSYDPETEQDVVVPATANGDGAHAEGIASKATANAAHAEGLTTTASKDGAHSEGYNTTASGMYAHSEGNGTVASGNNSHAEGRMTESSGLQAHAEGYDTTATGNAAHAEGNGATAGGSMSHAEGFMTTASAQDAHAEGERTTASGVSSHSEGALTKASGNTSHAEGRSTVAKGAYSHAEGESTVAAGRHSHVFGRYNTEDNVSSWPEYTPGTLYKVGDKVKVTTGGPDPDTQQWVQTSVGYICKQQNSDSSMISTKWYEAMNYVEIVGNGLSDSNRSNARTLDWSGNERLSGELYVNCTSSNPQGSKVLNEKDLDKVAIGSSAEAKGSRSFAQGSHAIAGGADTHVCGKNNIEDGPDTYSDWEAGHSYAIGDKVRTETPGGYGAVLIQFWVCKTANSDQTFTSSNWTRVDGDGSNYVEIVGNGLSASNRSNARTLDWDGNERLKGDLYVGCNADSTGGEIVATKAYVDALFSSIVPGSGVYF